MVRRICIIVLMGEVIVRVQIKTDMEKAAYSRRSSLSNHAFFHLSSSSSSYFSYSHAYHIMRSSCSPAPPPSSKIWTSSVLYLSDDARTGKIRGSSRLCSGCGPASEDCSGSCILLRECTRWVRELKDCVLC